MSNILGKINQNKDELNCRLFTFKKLVDDREPTNFQQQNIIHLNKNKGEWLFARNTFKKYMCLIFV